MHEECLSFTLTSFLNAGWISERQLRSMIEGLSNKDQEIISIITLKLLHLNHQQFFSPSNFEINLAKVLLATAPLAQFQPPLRFLAMGDLPEFQLFCDKSEDEELRRVGRAAMGLFPPASQGNPKCLYLPADSKPAGNPGWIWARKSLRDYYRLKLSKMSEQIKEIYNFLLSSEQMLHKGAQPFRQCWSSLYLLYNWQILRQNLKQFTSLKTAITWSTISLEQTFEKLRDCFDLLSLQERLPYFLALNLLNPDQKVAPFITYSPLEASFHLYLQYNSQIHPEIQLMLLLFFLKCADRLCLPAIAEECRIQYRRLLQGRKPKVTLYLSFFLPLEEIADNLILLSLSPSQIPTKSSTRQRLYDILLQAGRTYPEGIIQLSRPAILNHFLSEVKLADALKGEQLTMQAGRAVDMWVQRLAIELPSVDREEIEQGFITFLDRWNKYYMYLKTCRLVDLYAAIQTGQYLKEFFPLPRSSPEAAFNILMCSVRLFRQEDIDEKIITQFENSAVPELLSILPSGRADLFQQEWNSLLGQNSKIQAQFPPG